MKPRALLPGIHVDRVDPPAPEALPRMDVAVFVGLAESGPVHRAVAVESVAAYQAVFGGDVALAFDPARGETVFANLARSVRAFFSNGGRRCWVVRVAMTAELAALSGAPGAAAQRTSFALNGLLACAPKIAVPATATRPALRAARSLGSWADDITLSARALRESVVVSAPTAIPGIGFSFADRDGLAAGDLLELAGDDSSVRYAKIVRVDRGIAWALWITGFTPLDSGADSIGQAQMAGDPAIYQATLSPGRAPPLTIAGPLAQTPWVAGRWVTFERQGKAGWLIIDRIDANDPLTAIGRAWMQIDPDMPQGDFAARRCTLEIAEDAGGTRRFTAGIGLAREHPAAIHAMLDDDLFYAPAENRSAARRAAFALTGSERERLTTAMPRPGAAAAFGGAGFTAADRLALRTGWLPLGLGAAFGEPARGIDTDIDALTRDGLGMIDETLFLDPRLAPLTLAGLAAEAERLRDIEQAQLFGIHAAIDIPGDLHSPASLIAVPDACQPSIVPAGDDHRPPAPKPGAPSLPRWIDHAGGCAGGRPPAPPDAPDWSRFLDCATEALATPAFVDPPATSRTGTYTLEWQADAPGTVYVVEEAGRFDFADATEVLRAADATNFVATARAEGAWYYRLHIERAGNVSRYAACRVVVRTTAMVVAAETAAALGQRLRRVQVPLLRLCAATQDFFAILSLPRDFRAAQAGDHSRSLANTAPGFGGGDALGVAEERAVSYGARYHPWLAAQQLEGMSAPAPAGAMAGLYAARATARGAWIAPANDLLVDIIGLDPAMPDGDLAGLDAARVNAIRRVPAGFTLLDQDTLSPEADWRPVHVRRLMMLIRRAALRRGVAYVFEPNGDVVRRAVARSFSTMLDDLETRGAFAGAQPGGAWRVQLPEAANDRDDGRLTVEIAVSPAGALRTLALRLTQIGNRLTIGEVA